MTAADKVNLTA